MNELKTIVFYLENLMKGRAYPESVIETAIGCLSYAQNPLEMARKVKLIVERAKSPREVVKNLQPLIKEME